MAILIQVQGESGTGKSFSLRNLPAEKTLLIMPVFKPLPFRAKQKGFEMRDPEKHTGNIFVSDKVAHVCAVLKKTDADIIHISDCQFFQQNQMMIRCMEKGYDKFSEIAKIFYDILDTASKLPEHKRVYFEIHTELDPETNVVRSKTCGKMVENQMSGLESRFTIVLRAQVTPERQYVFSTQTDGHDRVKSPPEMFNEFYIPNDLNAVDRAVCEYYGIERPYGNTETDTVKVVTKPTSKTEPKATKPTPKATAGVESLDSDVIF